MASPLNRKNAPLWVAIAAGAVFVVTAAVALPADTNAMGMGLKCLLVGSAALFILAAGTYVAMR